MEPTVGALIQVIAGCVLLLLALLRPGGPAKKNRS
jgi:hypothetical protein